jgi:hypothetical protein
MIVFLLILILLAILGGSRAVGNFLAIIIGGATIGILIIVMIAAQQ